MKTKILASTLFFSLLILNLPANAQLVPEVTGSTINNKEAQRALDFHNRIRKEVGVSSLLWSTELSAFAQLWANKLAAEGCKLEHRPASGKWAQMYGENIYFGTAKGLTAEDAS